jgi:hypothetical protein
VAIHVAVCPLPFVRALAELERAVKDISLSERVRVWRRDLNVTESGRPVKTLSDDALDGRSAESAKLRLQFDSQGGAGGMMV